MPGSRSNRDSTKHATTASHQQNRVSTVMFHARSSVTGHHDVMSLRTENMTSADDVKSTVRSGVVRSSRHPGHSCHEVIPGGMLAVVIASGAGLLLVLIVLFLTWSRQRQRRRRDPFDLTLDDVHNESLSVKSAPASRSPSPRQVKRLSCPDVLAVPMTGGVLPGLTAGHSPDYALPTERVQPRSDGHCAPLQDTGDAGTVLHYHHELIGGPQPHMHSLRRSLTDDEDMVLPRSTHGRLWYSLLYDASQERLSVTLITVKDLPGRGCHNQPRDPYVKLFMLPDDRKSCTSKMRKKTLSPVFNENFIFQVTAQELKERTLRFSVYDVDKRKVRHSLGHVMVPLGDVDLDHMDTYWADLEANTQLASSMLGEVQMGLCYQPQNEKLKVIVQRARHLEHLAIDRQARLYIRLRLYYGRKLNRTKFTESRQNWAGNEVEFSESFAFSLAGKQIDSCRLETALIQTAPPHLTAPRPGQDAECGRLVLGPFMYARGEQLLHWQHVVVQPRVTVTRWHVLTAPVSHD